MEKANVLGLIDRWPHLFRKDFKGWLDSNWHIWVAFSNEASRMYARGRSHYSARTIVEWLRHETALRSDSGEFKINGNYVPDLARLWVCIHPQRSNFFEIRHMPTAVRAV